MERTRRASDRGERPLPGNALARTIVRMIRQEDQTVEDVAEHLHMPVETIRDLYREAVRNGY